MSKGKITLAERPSGRLRAPRGLGALHAPALLRKDEAPAILRTGFGLLFLYQVVRALPLVGVSHRFHVAIVPEGLVPSPSVMMLLLASRALLAAAMVANIYAPTACALSSLGLLFQLLCDRLDYHNNRYALALYGLALLPHLLRRGQDEPENSYADLLPVRLQCAFIYLCSGGSKALDTDWRSGRVIAERIATFGPQAVAKGVPSSVVHFLGTEACSSLLAKGAISLELALVVLPFFRKTRKYVLFAGVLFHLVIEVVAKVEGFSALTLLAYLAFVPPRNYGPQR